MQLVDPFITVYVLVIAGLLGLVMGSFINCWAWRAVHGESILRGRSHCTTCGHDLSARDLVPVISWLLSGRKCRYCGAPVSVRYPATELVCAVVFMAITWSYGLSLETLELLAFSGVLLFLSLTDLDECIIPNGCIIVALVIRIAYLAISWAMGTIGLADIGYYAASALGMGAVLVAITLVADRIFGRESMGFGDLKLYFVAVFYFGWQQGLFLVIVSCIIGLIVAALGPRPDAADATQAPPTAPPSPDDEPSSPQSDSFLKRTIPFGPSIAAACIVTMLFGPSFIGWYLGLL